MYLCVYVRFYVGYTFVCLPGVSGLGGLGGGGRMGEEVSYHIVHLHHLGHLDQLDGMYVSNVYVGFYVCMFVCLSGVGGRGGLGGLGGLDDARRRIKRRKSKRRGERMPPDHPFSSTFIYSIPPLTNMKRL